MGGMDAGGQTKVTPQIQSNEKHHLSTSSSHPLSSPTVDTVVGKCTADGGFPWTFLSQSYRSPWSDPQKKKRVGPGHRRGCCRLHSAHLQGHPSRVSEI